MKNNIYTLAILLLLSSCSISSESQSSEVSNTPSDDFKSILINVDAEEVKLASAIETMEIMQLEEGDEGFINAIHKLSESPEHLVIVDSNQPSDFIYNKEGKFEGTFNHTGDG
ncbi:MAG: 6-bladed beta-propeller, partial [Cytophagia bacterium]|nr:6-bladed beta-propeller [Cytophagia bacterium]